MHIIVVGAGAAGLMAAYAAGKNGADVTVIEKNEKSGKKIYITGKGRCNVTNACEAPVFFDNIISNPKFMYTAFYSFDNRALMDFMKEHGTRLKTERGERVFPVSDHASDITKALINSHKGKNIKIRFNTRIKDILTDRGSKKPRVMGVLLTDGSKIPADAVILACGGATYPASGGCWDGYEIAKKHGINVTDIRPALVPFLLKEDYIKEMQGLSLKNISLNIYDDRKKIIYSGFGEMLFTHFGISGPLVLSASSMVGGHLSLGGELFAAIDLKPAIPDDELDLRLIRMIQEKPRQIYSNFYQGLLPGSMHAVMVGLSKIAPDKKISEINAQERRRIRELLKSFPATITGTMGFSEAIITQGGVDVKEINPSTMECKGTEGLYMCGEMLDVDALTGGFNLQCAFSMGHLAGTSASIKERG